MFFQGDAFILFRRREQEARRAGAAFRKLSRLGQIGKVTVSSRLYLFVCSN